MRGRVSRRRWVLAALTVSGMAGGCRSAVADFYAPLTRPPECGVSGSGGEAMSGGGGGGGGEWATGGAQTGGQGGGPGAAGNGGCPLDACVLALRNQGYAIDAAEPETGLVVTFRRPVEQGSGPGARLFRAYILEVKATAGGRARVSAWPAVSEADVARGNRPYTAAAWEMDEERAAWARLFEDIRGLVERASP